MEIDVLMCGYNEAPHIPRALESLRAQSVEPRSFRIIFVDNASKDETRRIVEENSHGLNLEYVYEPQPGLNVARNTGYAHASADYVAHIDADAKADPRWIETALEVIRQERPDLCGGPYYPFYLTEKPDWFLDSYNSSLDKGAEARYLRDDEFLNGTNMIWRRSVVEELGGFNAHVGLTERGLARGDETNLIVHARRTLPHFRAFYHPGIIVYHLTRPETFSLWYWARRSFSQGRHDYGMWNKTTQKRSKVLRLAQFLSAATMVGARGAKSFVQRDRGSFPRWENYWFETMMPEIYRLGEVWELARERAPKAHEKPRAPESD
jgi:glycosyltransferase involved in cell wall biosynthesis